MSAIQPPPRLLLGATLLFWGAMTGRPFIGLLLALIVESPQWLRWRWDFDAAAFARAWQLGILLTGGLMLLMFIDGERAMVMPTLISWLPALVLPTQLAQSFGLRPSMPLGALSIFAARRHARNQRLGIEEREVMFHFGNAYFVVILVSAALGVWAEGRLFLPGLLVLCAWRFLALPHRRVAPTVVVLLAAGGLALVGQASLNALYDWLSRGGHGRASWMSDATHGFTAIGSMQDLKLSPEIKWRLRPEPGSRVPRLLRRASFNRFRGTTWEIARQRGAGSLDEQFTDIDVFEPVVGESYYLANPRIDSESATSARLPHFSMRGSAEPGGALPLPGNVTSFLDFELDAAQRNPLATIRVYPASPVIHGRVLWQPGTELDGEPLPEFDFTVPRLERDMLRRVVAEIGLDDATTPREKLALLQAWFAHEFGYTLYLSMAPPPQSLSGGTPIGRFLETTRRGHCEYFATAAALLLREAGLATRYTTGYAVLERDARRGEYVVRGIHGHAWCRVWLDDEQRWVDFDPTPGDWFALEADAGITLGQRIADALKRLREDLFIWRSDPGNRMRMLWIIAAPALFGSGWIAWRLLKSRHRTPSAARLARSGAGQPSALFSLESTAARHLGPRPHGEPYARWLLPLASQLHADSAAALHEAIALHQRLRYDSTPPPDADDARRMQTLTRNLRHALRNLGKS